MPDRDFYRKKISSFQTIYTYFENRLVERSFRDRRLYQPHYSALGQRITPYATAVKGATADGVCAHYLRRGFLKPEKMKFNCAVWSSDASLLILGSEKGDLVTWEGESLKVKKMNAIQAHKGKSKSK